MGIAQDWRRVAWEHHQREVVVDCRRVRYVDYGDGPPVLMVHGMAGSWEAWLANIPALAERHRVIAVDLPGFGASDPLERDDSFDGYVDTLLAVLDELAIPSVAVIGHSLGGLVALSVAERAPHRVRCLVLVSGGGADLSAVRLRAIRVVFACLAGFLAIPGAHKLLTSRLALRAVTWLAIHDGRDVPLELLRRMMPRRVGPGFMAAVTHGSRQLSRMDLRRVTAPVLLVWGRHDRILPLSTGQELDRELRQSRLVVVESAGHCAMFEEPREFLDLTTNFLGMQLLDRHGPPVDRASAHSWGTPRVQSGAAERYGDGNAG